MNKFRGYMLSMISALMAFLIFAYIPEYKLSKSLKSLNYINESVVIRNYPVMSKVVAQKNNILVIGTEDLERYNEKTYPSDVFNYGNSEFNFTLLGNPEESNLTNAISLGAYSKNYNNKLVILINTSDFTKDGITNSFSTIFNSDLYIEMLKNDRISDNTKKNISNRAKYYFGDNQYMLEKIEKINTEYANHNLNFVRNLADSIENYFVKLNFSLRNLDLLTSPLPLSKEKVKLESIRTADQLKIAERQGAENITNNPYFISDSYFTANFSSKLSELEGSRKKYNFFEDSPEFTDYKLLLDVVKDLGLETMVIIVPMNAKWYDFTGYDMLNRKRLYSKLASPVKELSSEKIIIKDFTEHEDDPYFLRSPETLGWKGWALINEAILEFAEKSK